MREVQSKTRRNLVIAGAVGVAALAAPQVWQTRLVGGVILPAAAQEIPPRTDEVKVQYGHRKGRWGLPANGYNTIPLAIYNKFAQGTTPVVEEVQIHFRLDHPNVKHLTVQLMSPDGHTITLIDRPGAAAHRTLESCSTKGVDVTFVDNKDSKFAPFDSSWCPERRGNRMGGWLGKFVEKFGGNDPSKHHLHGIFHSHWSPRHRLLDQFKGRSAVGNWHLRVHNHLNHNVNKVIRQIDLTVYSKW